MADIEILSIPAGSATNNCPERAKDNSPGQGQASVAMLERRPGYSIHTNCRPSIRLENNTNTNEAETSAGLFRPRLRSDRLAKRISRTIASPTTNPGRRQSSLRCDWLCPGLVYYSLSGNVLMPGALF